MTFQEDMRKVFCSAISEYSEDNWCASWLMGIEDIIRKEGGSWISIAFLAGGWPRGYNGEGGWDPLTEEELKSVDYDYIRRLIEKPGDEDIL